MGYRFLYNYKLFVLYIFKILNVQKKMFGSYFADLSYKLYNMIVFKSKYDLHKKLFCNIPTKVFFSFLLF